MRSRAERAATTKTLAGLMTAKSKLPGGYLDARKVDHDLISEGLKRLVYREGRPAETVDRAAYTGGAGDAGRGGRGAGARGRRGGGTCSGGPGLGAGYFAGGVDLVVSHHYLEGMSETKQRMSAEERRELVLDVAALEFAGRGLHGTSTEDVARRAGISQPYLFRLFPTKKALFLALVERCYQRIEEAFIAAAADRTGDEALEAMGDEYERLLDNRTLLLLQMHAYAACDDAEIRDVTRTGFKKLWELTERLTGLPYQTVVDFFAVGMLMNVAAAMDLPAVDERWTRWCPKWPSLAKHAG